MIPTSDGSSFEQLAKSLDHDAAAVLRQALIAAIGKSSELTAEVAVLCRSRNLDPIEETRRNVAAIESTALDAAAAVIQDALHAAAGVDAVAFGTALGAAVSSGNPRQALYRAGSALGDVEAIASGNPEKIIRRAETHVFWRAFGKLGRALFRKLGG